MPKDAERPSLVEMLDHMVELKRQMEPHLVPGEIRAMLVTGLAAIGNHVEGPLVLALIDLADGQIAPEYMELFTIAGMVVPVTRPDAETEE